MHRARDQKMFWDQQYSQEIKKNDVYMILYVNKIMYHVIYIYQCVYIYIIVSCAYRERKREKNIHTYLINI